MPLSPLFGRDSDASRLVEVVLGGTTRLITLTGLAGIGFFVWDEWNNLSLEHIILAILLIGVVGLALDRLMLALARLISYAPVERAG